MYLLEEAAPQLQTMGIALAAFLGLAATITSSMVLFNLRSMSKRIDENKKDHNDRLDKIEATQSKLAERKNICNQDYVGKVDFLRFANSQEELMRKLVESVSTLNGNMKLVEQMPKICATIARDVIKEMKNNG
jgi:superfamily II RNA helicase